MKTNHSLEEIIRPYFDRFKNVEGYFVRDNRALNFFRHHQKNTDPQDVLLKVIEVKDEACLASMASDALMKHIVSLGIDDQLAAQDLLLVNKIAQVQLNGKSSNFYAFASKYCNMHHPGVYPVYNDFLARMLPAYFREQKGMKIDIGQLHDYMQFKQIMTEFTESLNLPFFDYREFDKFIWLYGREVTMLYRQETQTHRA